MFYTINVNYYKYSKVRTKYNFFFYKFKNVFDYFVMLYEQTLKLNSYAFKVFVSPYLRI